MNNHSIKNTDNLTVQGQSTLKAFQAGELSRLLRRGFSLPGAISIAKDLGYLRHENTVRNLVVSVGKLLLCDLLIDAEETGLTYHAIGTGATAPNGSDTLLTSESERKVWSLRTRASNQLQLSVFYLSTESTFNIKECGVFGGSTATSTHETGILFSHYLQAYDNSAGLVDLTFEYLVTIG